MPTGKVEGRAAEAKARLIALRDAARTGIADIDAGRYRTFDSPEELIRHLDTLRSGVLARCTERSGTPA